MNRQVPEIFPGVWYWYAQCQREDFVNCTYGARGTCQNARHQRGEGR